MKSLLNGVLLAAAIIAPFVILPLFLVSIVASSYGLLIILTVIWFLISFFLYYFKGRKSFPFIVALFIVFLGLYFALKYYNENYSTTRWIDEKGQFHEEYRKNLRMQKNY